MERNWNTVLAFIFHGFFFLSYQAAKIWKAKRSGKYERMNKITHVCGQIK
jgi:hypothetical protein